MSLSNQTSSIGCAGILLLRGSYRFVIHQPRVYYAQKGFRCQGQVAATTEGAAHIEARIRVRLTPRAARDEIAGWQGDVLRVRVSAPPVEGRANAALEHLLAGALGVPKSAVRVASGAHAREKLVVIEGLKQAEAMLRLGAATPM